MTTINEGGTGYSHADRQTGWDEPGLGYHSGWRHPAWVDNDTTMISNPTHVPNRDVILDRISDGGNGHGNMVMNWFSDTNDNPHASGGDITRDKRKVALQTGSNDSTLTVYFIPEFPTAWRDGNPIGASPFTLLPLREPRRRHLRRADVVAGRRRARLPRRRRHPRRGRPGLRERAARSTARPRPRRS